MTVPLITHLKQEVQEIRKLSHEDRVRGISAFALSLSASGLGWYVGMHLFSPTPIWIDRQLGVHETQVVIALLAIFAGIVAHRFKRRSQYWYGCVEVAFGCGSAFAIAFSMNTRSVDLPRLASLIGAGYVIARGLNNMRDALTRLSTEQI